MDNRLFVHGIVECLAHAPVVKGFHLGVKAEVLETECRIAEMLILPILRVDAHLIHLLTRDNRLLQVPFQEFGERLL
jgi:hypothetical protein